MLFERWDNVTLQELSSSANQYWSRLDAGERQFDTTITYRFPTRIDESQLAYIPFRENANYRALEADLQDYFRFTAEYVSSFTGLELREVSAFSPFADIAVGSHNMDFAGYADYPFPGEQLVMLDNGQDYDAFGDFAAQILVHELGHALGLAHPFLGQPGEPGYVSLLPDDLQGSPFAVMAYDDLLFDFADAPVWVGMATFSPFDIQALQQFYGTGDLQADHTYNFISDRYGVPRWDGTTVTSPLDAPFTLVDTGGYDWVNLSEYRPAYSTGEMKFSFEIGLRVTTGGDVLTSEWDAETQRYSDWEGRDSIRMLTIQPGTTIERFTGSPFEDRIFLASGDQRVDGSTGWDTVVTGLSTPNATVSVFADGTVVIADRTGATGRDVLGGDIEELQFVDRQVNLKYFDGVLALSEAEFTELTEVYVAYFNRAADAQGLYFWANKLAEGVPLAQIADRFAEAPEARALYPDPSDTAAFVTSVYENVLGRASDEGGFAYWKDALDQGDVSAGTFVLELIRGAKTGSSSWDADYLAAKAMLGLDFAVIKGLSDGNDGRQVMETFGDQATSNLDGARSAIDVHYQDALSVDGDFVLKLVGVIDDPYTFA